MAYRSSNVSSRTYCIFEIHQLWQPDFSRVYSNCCCSCSFEPEIIKIGQSSHKMYSNNILNYQEFTTILKACTRKSGTYWIHHVRPLITPAKISIKDVPFLFALNLPLAEFTLGHYLASLSYKRRSKGDPVMLQYAVTAGLIQFAIHLVQVPDFAIGKRLPHHKWASSMLYDWCDTGGCSSLTNYLPYIDPPIWPKDFEFRLISPKEFLLSSIIQSLYALAHWSFWYCFASLTVVFWQQFCYIGPLHRVISQLLLIHIFSGHKFSCAVRLGAISLLAHKLVTQMKLSSALVVAFGLAALLFVLFGPISLTTLNCIINCNSENFLSYLKFCLLEYLPFCKVMTTCLYSSVISWDSRSRKTM